MNLIFDSSWLKFTPIIWSYTWIILLIPVLSQSCHRRSLTNWYCNVECQECRVADVGVDITSAKVDNDDIDAGLMIEFIF